MSSEIRFNAVIPPPRAKEKAAELAAMSTTHKGFGHEELPKSHDYREYIQFGFRTDYEIISRTDMKRLIAATRKR